MTDLKNINLDEIILQDGFIVKKEVIDELRKYHTDEIIKRAIAVARNWPDIEFKAIEAGNGNSEIGIHEMLSMTCHSDEQDTLRENSREYDPSDGISIDNLGNRVIDGMVVQQIGITSKHYLGSLYQAAALKGLYNGNAIIEKVNRGEIKVNLNGDTYNIPKTDVDYPEIERFAKMIVTVSTQDIVDEQLPTDFDELESAEPTDIDIEELGSGHENLPERLIQHVAIQELSKKVAEFNKGYKKLIAEFLS